MQKNERGITLIALVISIVVLSMLSSVTISALVGENGVLTKAQDSVVENRDGNVKEKVEMAWSSAITEYWKEWSKDRSVENKEFFTVENLNKYLGDTGGRVTRVSPNEDGTYLVKYKDDEQGTIYTFTMGEGGGIQEEESTSQIGALPDGIGDAINSENYGRKVLGYYSNGASGYTGDWRLFYQDRDYTYLICDSVIDQHLPSNYLDTYLDGSSVGEVGRNLNSMLRDSGDVFVSSNTNHNIRATAWLTDTEYWGNYKDADNKALFAIGSPTIELFSKSFNATIENESVNPLALSVVSAGYLPNEITSFALSSRNNNGIYNKNGNFIDNIDTNSEEPYEQLLGEAIEHSSTAQWFIASPWFGDNKQCFMVMESFGIMVGVNVDEITVSAISARPIVCFDTNVFQNTYTLE